MAASIVNSFQLHRQGCKLLRTRLFTLNSVCFNSNRTAITRIRRLNYTRMYPTLMVLSDGSTIRMRYNVPQKIIKLPMNVAEMSEEQKKRHTEKHKPKQKIVVEEEVEDDFNADEYSHLWKKK